MTSPFNLCDFMCALLKEVCLSVSFYGNHRKCALLCVKATVQAGIRAQVPCLASAALLRATLTSGIKIHRLCRLATLVVVLAVCWQGRAVARQLRACRI